MADRVTGKLYAALKLLKNRLDVLTDRIDVLDHRNDKKMTTDRLDQRIVLHKMIDEHFSVPDMRDLYFSCGLDYEAEIGDKSNRIWYLIDHYGKREKLLSKKCLLERPGLDWPFLDGEIE